MAVALEVLVLLDAAVKLVVVRYTAVLAVALEVLYI
jgi:hypothetical protein